MVEIVATCGDDCSQLLDDVSRNFTRQSKRLGLDDNSLRESKASLSCKFPHSSANTFLASPHESRGWGSLDHRAARFALGTSNT